MSLVQRPRVGKVGRNETESQARKRSVLLCRSQSDPSFLLPSPPPSSSSPPPALVRDLSMADSVVRKGITAQTPRLVPKREDYIFVHNFLIQIYTAVPEADWSEGMAYADYLK